MGDKLIKELREATANMSMREKSQFKRELQRRIPVLIHFAAEKSRTKIEEEKEVIDGD